MEFFAVSWRGDDIDDDTNEEDEDDGVSDKQYKISIFGKTIEGKSVCCTVPFDPFFYVALPDAFKTATDAMHIRDRIMSKMGRRFKSSVVVDDCVVVRRKPFYGFSNGTSRPFLRMVFRTRHAYAVAAKIIASDMNDLNLFESNVDPVLKLIHLRDLESTGWIRVAAWKTSEPSMSTCCVLDIEARHEDLHRSSSDHIPPLIMASFDIEANSHDGGFPNPDLEGNEVIQIGTVFQRYGESEPFAREILCLGRTSEIPGVDVRSFETEPEVLAAWSKSLRKRHVDVLIGYNIWGFDLQFMYKRSIFNYDDEKHRTEFLNIGKLCRGHQSSLRKTILSSSAYGHNEFMILETPGILQIDLMHVLQKEHKLESYSLNNVSKHFLGDAKLDMPARRMFDLYATKDPDNLRQIAEYCVKDCELPLLLMTKLAVLPSMIEMAKATHVPLEFLIPRGQQIKVFSKILKRLLERGYVCPTNPKRPHRSPEGYVGATVLEPKRGAYMDHPIATLDFASLYPSIMRSNRLCPSTIVLDPKYANVPGVEYLTIDVEGTCYKFAQNTEAIVPDLLRDLAQYRKQAKKDMADAKKRGDAFMTAVYDGKQLAIKVSMNSVYGFFGATNGFLPCAPIAAAVTSIGRDMILQTKHFVESTYAGAEVVYGDTDSVMIKFGSTHVAECFRLGQEAAEAATRLFRDPVKLEFEKVFHPYFLFAKKRYCGVKITSLDDDGAAEPTLDFKGIQLARRDNCPLVRAVSRKVLDALMFRRDPEAAAAIVREAATDLLEGRVDVADLILSKTLKPEASYKNPDQPHVHVARKLERRRGVAGSGPRSGERVPYVFVEAEDPAALQCTKAEDPDHVREHGLRVDALYYLEHQLESPMIALFELLIPDPQKTLFDDIKASHVARRTADLKEFKRKQRLKKERQMEITTFFTSKR